MSKSRKSRSRNRRATHTVRTSGMNRVVFGQTPARTTRQRSFRRWGFGKK